MAIISLGPIKERLQTVYDRLNERERRLLILLGSVLGGLVVIGGGLLLTERMSTKKDQIEALKKQVNEIKAIRGDFGQAKAKEERAILQMESNPISLFSLLQGLAARYGLTLQDLSETKKPSPDPKYVEVSTALNLKGLSIDRLSAFLESIEESSTEGLVKVTRLEVKSRFDTPELLDVLMTISTWKKA